MKILTSRGFRSFDGFVSNGIKEVGNLTIDGKQIVCTPNHRILIDGEWFYADEFEDFEITHQEEVFDAINVADGNEYLTNGLPSHNCLMLDEFAHVSNNIAEDFFASVYPTISSGVSSKLVMISTPLGMNHFLRFRPENIIRICYKKI